MHIPLKLHEDIPEDYRIMGCTKMKIKQNKQQKNNQRAITLKQKRWIATIIVHGTLS